MGSFAHENMDHIDFDPTQSRLVQSSGENGFYGRSSEDLYKSGVELEYDPSLSKLVPKTSYQNGGCTSTTEEAYKKGQEFDFDPGLGRLVLKKKDIKKEIEEEMRKPSPGKQIGFDKKKKCLKVEEKTRREPRRDREVKVDMNRRGTGGFF